jgi:hypothetical protein
VRVGPARVNFDVLGWSSNTDFKTNFHLYLLFFLPLVAASIDSWWTRTGRTLSK